MKIIPNTAPPRAQAGDVGAGHGADSEIENGMIGARERSSTR